VKFVSIVLASMFVLACKQGEGARCQVNADCADGLVCNKAKNTCQSTTGGDLDASIPDAPTTPLIDAGVDAPADATPDAP
jgi:hypothetical protein